MTVTAGTRLGPYEVVSRLGSGGMGEVYRARDTRLRRQVALKVLRGAAGLDQEQLLQEARLASTLNDPHIVSVYDVGEEAGTVFVAMELVDGVTLADRVRGGRLRLEETVRIAMQIASALARAHAAGLVHRDLKPANVMITADGHVKILDFGLAKRVSGATGDTATIAGASGSGMVVGTAAYMSPEQAEGRPVDARSDVFAFGVTLYELLTGRRPFERDSVIATLAAILRDPVEPLASLRPELPAELVRIVDRCLRKDPARRFQSAADLKVALEDVLDDLAHGQASATPAQSMREARPSTWRRLSYGAAGVALLAAAVMLVPVIGARQSTAPPLVAGDLVQLTFDPGYSGGAALSPDGTLVAFVSDRAGEGNLDIWIQPVKGGNPVRVTHDPEDERMPSFSPDGGRLVFRSERDGGGIYTVAALGGEPRLLVREGYNPRFSPDGTALAYWTGGGIGFQAVAGSYRTVLVDSTGGKPREVAGFTGARFPVWSPDGRHLVVAASRHERPTVDTYDWWVVPVGGGEAIPLRVRALLPKNLTENEQTIPPLAWTGSHVLTSVLGDIWAFEVDGQSGFRATRGERLTFGPANEQDVSATADGLVAFSHVASENNVWSLPIDSETGAVRGELQRVTAGVGWYSRPTVSSDERTVAFLLMGLKSRVVVQDLASGRIRDPGIEVGAPFGPTISPDGSRVIYQGDSGQLFDAPVGGGASRQICGDCETPGDWLADGQRAVVVTGIGSMTSLTMIEVATGERRTVAEHGDDGSLNRPHLSRDNRWLAFRIMRPANQVYVAPFGGAYPIPRSSWVPVGAPENDMRPIGWSPSGRMLYLMSSRDGFRCLYVQPMQDGHPLGQIRLVRHLHNIRAAGGGGSSVVSSGPGNVVTRDRILMDFPTQVVNIWSMQIGPTVPR